MWERGKVTWLPEDTTFEILERVEANPERALLEGGAKSHGGQPLLGVG